MPFVECASTWRRARPWLSAMAAVALVLAALAGPALAEERTIRSPEASGTPRLRDPGVSQRTARPSTTIRFWVTYRNGAGTAPTYVRVLIDGRPRAMTAATASEHYRRGVRYAYATKLPVGRHRVRFEAMSTDGVPARALGGAIRVVARSSGGGSRSDRLVRRRRVDRLVRRRRSGRPGREPGLRGSRPDRNPRVQRPGLDDRPIAVGSGRRGRRRRRRSRSCHPAPRRRPRERRPERSTRPTTSALRTVTTRRPLPRRPPRRAPSTPAAPAAPRAGAPAGRVDPAARQRPRSDSPAPATARSTAS